MATSRICPDTVTVFNHLGTGADRRDLYQATVLQNVHAAAAEGQIKTASVAEDGLKCLIFDENLTVPSGRAFITYRAWNLLDAEGKAACWTLSPDGKDYIGAGSLQTDEGHLPEDATLYQIQKVSRHQKGSARMRYWVVEAV